MPPRISCSPVAPSTSSLLQTSANFSSTASRANTPLARRKFYNWLTKYGSVLKKPNPRGGTNYARARGVDLEEAKDRPFPLNKEFKSSPVLDDRARELIWEKIMRKGETIKAVSAELGVDISRVAAVVRLKEVEKDWVSKGKKLATPYCKAVLSMLPVRSFKPDQQNQPLEDINELHIHPHTMKQLYWPTSESRQFTREDAAKVFHRKMLSADDRVPHPELIQMEKDLLQGKSPWEAKANFTKAAEDSERKAAEKQVQKALAVEQATTRINTKRFEFRFREINAEDVGHNGRKIDAVGARYGRPSYDRAKGAVKIPTSVP
ncbi:eukaryotic mitochondrial regulator protein-domain-containing protein [Xylariales sp. AK1849]|nr:eukaryotic mitochondrial regulator protein-domain-containing protein [Xylariales sp. AK1849]